MVLTMAQWDHVTYVVSKAKARSIGEVDFEFSIYVDGTKYAIQTDDRIYYSSSFAPNPLPISPELTGKSEKILTLYKL